jgi:hypothetical protein
VADIADVVVPPGGGGADVHSACGVPRQGAARHTQSEKISRTEKYMWVSNIWDKNHPCNNKDNFTTS